MAHLKLWRKNHEGQWTLAGEARNQRQLLGLQSMLQGLGHETKIEYCGKSYFIEQGGIHTRELRNDSRDRRPGR